jgi:transcriptional regulator with XRE-family HTH domain
MKERILEFLRNENKTSAQFAEEIGVQPSGISHIISGRNNPSLDFVLKMLEKYPYLSTEWLLFGKGTMYRDQHYGSLFDVPVEDAVTPSVFKTSDHTDKEIRNRAEMNESHDEKNADYVDDNTVVEKIAWFYADGTFEEYFRRK